MSRAGLLVLYFSSLLLPGYLRNIGKFLEFISSHFYFNYSGFA